MDQKISRRELLARGLIGGPAMVGAAALAPLALARGGAVPESKVGPESKAAPDSKDGPASPFGFCLNTSTISGHKLGLVEELELAAKVGYQGVELWLHEIDAYQKAGGTLPDLGKRIRDLGLAIPDAIAFPEWMVDDAGKRARALEEVRRRMEQCAAIGCTHLAAPPVGDVKGVDLLAAAERYRELLVLGDKMGVTPAVELWGFASNLHRLGQVMLVAMEADHPRACVVLDVYHLYKGGSGLSGIRHLSGSSIAIFHMNDYPADPPREKIGDGQRVFPGDGVAPLKQFFRDLRATGYRGMLSLELFNKEYYSRPVADVAREGLEKMRAAVQSSLGGA